MYRGDVERFDACKAAEEHFLDLVVSTLTKYRLIADVSFKWENAKAVCSLPGWRATRVSSATCLELGVRSFEHAHLIFDLGNYIDCPLSPQSDIKNSGACVFEPASASM